MAHEIGLWDTVENLLTLLEAAKTLQSVGLIHQSEVDRVRNANQPRHLELLAGIVESRVELIFAVTLKKRAIFSEKSLRLHGILQAVEVTLNARPLLPLKVLLVSHNPIEHPQQRVGFYLRSSQRHYRHKCPKYHQRDLQYFFKRGHNYSYN